MLSSITFLSSFYRFGFATTNDRTRPVGPIHQSLPKTDASHPNVEAKDSSSVDLCFAKSLIHSPLHRRRWRPLVNPALRLRCLNAFAIGALTHSVNASRRFTAAEWQRTKSYLITSLTFFHQRSAFSLTVMAPLSSSKLYRPGRGTSFGINARSYEALLRFSHDRHQREPIRNIPRRLH